MNENEQFILFVTGHGDKHISKTNIPVAPCPCLPAEVSLNIPPEMYHDMILDPSNQPDFCIFNSGPEEISLHSISVNKMPYLNYTAYPLDYNGNGTVDADEGFEYVFLIDEGILVEGENHIGISSNHTVEFVAPTVGLGSGAIAKVTLPAVGGIVEFPQLEEPEAVTPDLSDHNYGALAGIIVGAIVGTIALIGAAWYVRRRRTKAI